MPDTSGRRRIPKPYETRAQTTKLQVIRRTFAFQYAAAFSLSLSAIDVLRLIFIACEGNPHPEFNRGGLMNESPDFSLTNNKRRPIQSLEAPWREGLGWPRAIVQPARRNLRGRRF